MLKLKLPYFGHLIRRADSLEKTLMLGKIKGRRWWGDRGWNDWMASSIEWMWFGKPDVFIGVAKSRTQLSDWTNNKWPLGKPPGLLAIPLPTAWNPSLVGHLCPWSSLSLMLESLGPSHPPISLCTGCYERIKHWEDNRVAINILSKKLIFGIYIICENYLFLLVPRSSHPRTHSSPSFLQGLEFLFTITAEGMG